MKRALSRLVVAMLLGVLVYGVAVAWSGWQATRDSLVGFRWWTFAAALGLASANYALRFLKWEYYLGRLGVRDIPKLDSFLVFLSGFVLTITPGKVGEVFKSAVLAETHGVPVSRTAPIVVAERLTDVISVVALILVGSAGFSGGLPWAAAGLAGVGAGMVLILWRRPGEWFIAWLGGRPGAGARWAPRLAEAFESLRIVASPSALLFPTLISVVAWGAEGAALWLLLEGFGTPAPLMLSVFFYATATLAGAVVPVPGGLGVVEAIIRGQLVGVAHVPEGPATSAMILVRFATLWWAVLVGFAALGVLKLRFPGLMAAQRTETS